MNYKSTIAIIAVLTLGLAASNAFLLNKDKGDTANGQEKQNALDNWVSYKNEAMGFELRHPQEMQIYTLENQIGFTLIGPTQAEGTELYDGVAVGVRKVRFAGTLEEFVDQDMEMFSDVGTITGPLAPVNVGGINGLTYAGDALGFYHNIFLPAKAGEVVVISYLNPDPGNKGYKDITDGMIESFRLLN